MTDAKKPAHTPGPWAWMGNSKYGYYLATTRSGRLHVMDFKRKGMQAAQPTFRTEHCIMVPADDIPIFAVCPDAKDADDPRVYRTDIIGFRNADATLIAVAPELYSEGACSAKVMRAMATQLENIDKTALGEIANELRVQAQAQELALAKARGE